MPLRPYQEEAVAAFEAQQRVGVLNMATGTGKTITSIAAIQRDYQTNCRQFLVIIVPFTHLVAQWLTSLRQANISVDLRIMGDSRYWRQRLPGLVWAFSRGFSNRVVVIGTYKSICSSNFETAIQQLPAERTFLLADECHYVGALQRQRPFLHQFDSRLGLSATPNRWWDESGTAFIRTVFGADVFVYGMDKAIQNGFLTPYTYDPVITRLDSEEMATFDRLTKRINASMAAQTQGQSMPEAVKRLLLRRSRLIKSAAGKMALLEAMITKQVDPHYTLVYCANKAEVGAVVAMLAAHGIQGHRFDSSLALAKRTQVLEAFAAGEIAVLVAVKCLDEGVDVPATREAYFLASTSNPREFVQRRGRILRRALGKQKAMVHDFVVLPPRGYSGKYAEQLIRHELPRVYELNAFAANKYAARAVLAPVLRKLQLERYLDKSSQAIYLESQKERDGYDITA
ncbi:MAG: DEAD/DEAH box helicase family protein [Lactobacillus sp.]|jgi:superfamily II DNA or RNA helicase|nr:DEAD/DEAH box helicase family protein [Lactobacillus sp.]MCI2032114.1 DEAD/DEAH box helicase family protein [Lactobacillus sp.]